MEIRITILERVGKNSITSAEPSKNVNKFLKRMMKIRSVKYQNQVEDVKEK